MTNEQIASTTLYRLHALSERQLKQEQFETQALAIIADAVSAGRGEGEASGFAKGESAGFSAGITMGTRHACETQAFVVKRSSFEPISAAEVNAAEPKAEEPSS